MTKNRPHERSEIVNKFKDGQDVHALYFPDDSVLEVGGGYADKITVVMENGQMAGVPWFEVWADGKIVSKWNGALLSGVKP